MWKSQKLAIFWEKEGKKNDKKKAKERIFFDKVGNPVLLSKLFRLLSYSMRAQDDFLFAKHSFVSDFDGEKKKSWL